MAFVSRFVKHQTFSGEYKGCCYALLHNSGLKGLAKKLCMDSDTAIPIVFQGPVREIMLDGVREFELRYFNTIHGFESRVTPDANGLPVFMQTMSYDANERGEAYENKRQDAITKLGSHSLSATGESGSET